MENKKSRFNLELYLQESKNKAYFVVAVTILFAVLVIVAGILPAYSAIAKQNRQNRLRESAISQLENKVKVLKIMIQEEEGSSELINSLSQNFPDQPPQEQIISEMDDLSNILGVSMVSITFSESQRDVPIQAQLLVDPQVKAQEVTVSLVGSRESLRNFVDQVEKSIRIYNIRNLTMQRRSISNAGIVAGSDFQMTLQMEYFYWDSEQN